MTESQDERLGLPSASSWRRYELCAGSYQLEGEARRLNQEAHVGGEAAQRGTRIHAFLAGELDEDGEPITLSLDEQEAADFLQARAQEQAERIFGNEPTQQLAEKRLWLSLDGRKVASGRFDRVLWSGTMDIALIQDFKSGQLEPQEAEISSQMKFLAVIVGLALPSVREIVVQIVSVFYGVSEQRFSIEALAEAYRNVLKTLRAIQAKEPPLNVTIEGCRWCSAQLICPAQRTLLSPLTKFSVVQLSDDPARASKLLDEIAILRNCFDEIEAWYKTRLEEPDFKIDGYGLVPNAPRREISDVAKAKARLLEFLDEAELNQATSMTLGDLEKALGRKLGIRDKEQLRSRFNSILEGLILEKTPKPSLKRTGGKPKFTEAALEQRMALSNGEF